MPVRAVFTFDLQANLPGLPDKQFWQKRLERRAH